MKMKRFSVAQIIGQSNRRKAKFFQEEIAA
jgi:hypothetical protein